MTCGYDIRTFSRQRIKDIVKCQYYRLKCTKVIVQRHFHFVYIASSLCFLMGACGLSINGFDPSMCPPFVLIANYSTYPLSVLVVLFRFLIANVQFYLAVINYLQQEKYLNKLIRRNYNHTFLAFLKLHIMLLFYSYNNPFNI